VPLIVVPPRRLAARFAAAGSRCNQPVSLIDLYPTLAELCGVAAPGQLDGQSLVPLLRDPERATGRAVVTMFDRGNASLRTRRWRYIRYANGAKELYDMQQDPHEWSNVAGEQTRQRIQLQQMLSKFYEQVRSQ
jgi:iduronate 2-sulfatase